MLPSRAAPPAQVSIAVLPFSDMSAAKDQEYLCEGMAEEIMNALVRIDGIRVASRTSTFRAGRNGDDLGAISRALSVGHVLEGSVRTAGARLRVTAQLTDVSSGYIDSKTYQLGTAGIITPTGAATQYRRHVYTSVVRVKNPSERLETP